MRIDRLRVSGYRNFRDQQILFENGTTVLAGANNSGKTSLIDLLTVMLTRGHELEIEDLNAIDRHVWSCQLLQALLNGKGRFGDALLDDRLSEGVPKVETCVEIAYDKQRDDIREFADFLMDLDLSKNAFYFVCEFAPRLDRLRARLEEIESSLYEVMEEKRWKALPSSGKDARTLRDLQGRLCNALFESIAVNVYFTDSSFDHRVKMEKKRFQELFNIRLVQASRPLDDTISDKTGELSRRFVKSMKGEPNWEEVIKTLPASVINSLESAGIGEKATEAAIASLNETIASIAKTNGKSKSDLFLDFQLTEADALSLVARAIQARYLGGGVPLNEKSQGLGYSNLIILHLEVEAFLRSAKEPKNQFLVNLLIVEEPESHMHPQMQNAFIGHLFRQVTQEKIFQALVTTHSNEIVRSSKIEHLRVLKVLEDGAHIIDLQKFHTENVAPKSEEDRRLFNLLYAINFADVLFADKVVMYEGDTERMYFQALIREMDDLAPLRTQYVSYVQVGGAHAHIYLPLIVDTLKIRTVIITDVDYQRSKATDSVEQVKALQTSNSTINLLFEQSDIDAEGNECKRGPVLGELYASKDENTGLALFEARKNLAVSFQGEAEGFSRTLEEALLAKAQASNAWDRKGRDWWKEYRRDSKLDFSIPNGEGDFSILEIVAATSGRKTDFMYSYIMREGFHEATPNYVYDALKWLSND